MTQPAHDVQVSPLEELKLKAELDDDFGVVRHGVSFSMAGHEPREIVLPGTAAKSRQVRPEHLIDFESLKAGARPARHLLLLGRGYRPGRPAPANIGRHVLRRSPPFEEIFRQGEQPPSGSAENEEQEGNRAMPSRPTNSRNCRKKSSTAPGS